MFALSTTSTQKVETIPKLKYFVGEKTQMTVWYIYGVPANQPTAVQVRQVLGRGKVKPGPKKEKHTLK